MGAVILCTALAMAGAPLVQTAAFIAGLPLAVLLIATRFGLGPAVVTAVAGVLAFDYVFVPPAMAFAIPNLRDGLTIAIMVTVAVTASVLAEQLRGQVRRARHQAELEGLRNTLLSGLSHDLRSPLTALVGASNALYEGRLEEGQRTQFAKMLVDEANRLSRLVGNLLELTRLESGRVNLNTTPQAVEEVIGAALCRLDHRLHHRAIRTHVPEDIPFASFDPVLMEQVFINLLENVIRHTPEGTPVDISVSGGAEHILVEIADRGPGVRQGDEERVFERLYRSTGAGDGGIGLGLAICRAIVSAHEGRISLENREGGGAVVRLSLPVRFDSRAFELPFHGGVSRGESP
jgi:two-component system sensor histidine kinase KdpD